MHNPIPNRLKIARKKNKITQKDLGIKIGIDENSASARMNHYEQNRNVPDFSTVERFANALNMPFLYFFCEDDLMADLICEIDRLSEDEKKALLISLLSSQAARKG